MVTNAIAAIAIMGFVQARPSLTRFEYSQIHMGVAVRITLFATDEQVAEAGARAAFERFAELEAIMSDYRPDSELMRLCASPTNTWVDLSPDLSRVLQRSQEVAKLTDGAFDITASPVIRLWREARRTKRMPALDRLGDARSRVGYPFLEIESSRARITKAGMQLDLGGIAKGDAADQAILVLKAKGIERALVEAGGDIVASGPPPGKLGWRIEVRGESEPFLLRNSALSTSGDRFQSVKLGGKTYSHIVDPRTGLGLTHRREVTVVAPDGLTSDSLATAFSVLGKVDAALANRFRAQVWIR